MVRSLYRFHQFQCLGVATLLLVGCGGSEQASYSICPVPVLDSAQRGDEDAWVTIVEFADFQCSYCRMAEDVIAEVDERQPGLRWVFKHLPLVNIHAFAEAAASAADCANSQGKFWEMHERLFAGKTAKLDDNSLNGYAKAIGLNLEAWERCFKSGESLHRILVDYLQGKSYGVSGTPTFFVNGRVLSGLYSADEMIDVIKDVEREAKQSGIARAEYYQTIVHRDCTDQ